jgi:hypothetical protein
VVLLAPLQLARLNCLGTVFNSSFGKSPSFLMRIKMKGLEQIGLRLRFPCRGVSLMVLEYVKGLDSKNVRE